jgi:hypothetical protein
MIVFAIEKKYQKQFSIEFAEKQQFCGTGQNFQGMGITSRCKILKSEVQKNPLSASSLRKRQCG